MIEPTDEMVEAQAAAFSDRMAELLAAGGAFDMTDPKRAGLAAVLAIVERDHCLERRGHVWHPLDKTPPTPPKTCGSTRWGMACELPDGHPGGHGRSTWQAWA